MPPYSYPINSYKGQGMADNNGRTKEQEMAVIYVLSDAGLVWDILGVEGVSYKFDTCTLRMDERGRKLCQMRMGAADSAIASKYAQLISVNDYEAIGRMVVDQFEGKLGAEFKEVEERLMKVDIESDGYSARKLEKES